MPAILILLCLWVAVAPAAGAETETRDSYGRTPLILAAEQGDLKTVQSLLHRGADVNAKRDDGASALTLAARDGYSEIVGALLQAGADAKSEGGALSLAAERGHTEIVAALIQAGAPVNAPSNQWTALMGAAENGHTNIVEALTRAGANVNAHDPDDSTALILAVSSGHTDTVHALIAAGANVNTRLPTGETPLMIAARGGDADTVQALIAAGADVTAQDRESRTAATWALWGRHPEIVQLLNADPRTVSGLLKNLKDPSSKTRYSAVISLGLPGNQPAVKPLVELLESEKDLEIRSKIVGSLGMIGDKGATQALLKIAEGEDEKLSKDAIESLIYIKDPRAIPVLRKLYWNTKISMEASRALFALGDGAYITTANDWKRILALLIPLTVMLCVLLASFVLAKERRFEFLRLAIAVINTGFGFLLGFSFFFLIVVMLGSLLHVVNTRGEWVLIGYLGLGYFYGAYSAFFCFLATYFRIRNVKVLTNALAAGSVPFLLAPFLLITMSAVFSETNDAITSRWSVFLSGFHSEQGSVAEMLLTLLAPSLAVFIDSLILSLPLDRLRKQRTRSRLEELSLLRFCILALVVSALFLLHIPLTKYLMGLTYN